MCIEILKGGHKENAAKFDQKCGNQRTLSLSRHLEDQIASVDKNGEHVVVGFGHNLLRNASQSKISCSP